MPGLKCSVASAQVAEAAGSHEGVQPRGLFGRIAPAEHQPARRRKHGRQQIRGAAKKEKQRVCQPGPLQANEVIDVGRPAARVGEAGVVGVVTEQRHEQHQRHGTGKNDRAFAQGASHAFGEPVGRFALRCGIGQLERPCRERHAVAGP
jgi:hypothetical protein